MSKCEERDLHLKLRFCRRGVVVRSKAAEGAGMMSSPSTSALFIKRLLDSSC